MNPCGGKVTSKCSSGQVGHFIITRSERDVSRIERRAVQLGCVREVRLTCGSTSQPWQRGMSSRSNTMHSGVYSKTRTPVNFTFTSRPVCSLCNTAMASLMFQETRETRVQTVGRTMWSQCSRGRQQYELQLYANKSLAKTHISVCIEHILQNREAVSSPAVFVRRLCLLHYFWLSAFRQHGWSYQGQMFLPFKKPLAAFYSFTIQKLLPHAHTLNGWISSNISSFQLL